MMRTVVITLISTLSALSVWAQGLTDVHSHNVMPSYLDFLKSHDALMEEGFPLPEWNVEEHLRAMDEAGIEISILTMPAPQPFFGDVEESKRIVRQYNEETAAICRQHPHRFRFCASLPLPFVEAAIAEAVYALDTLHADGVKLATNVRGQYLGDPQLDTLMAVLNERHPLVILHPHRPTPVNQDVMVAVPLAVYEYPAETTRALVNMIAHNVPMRYPNVRFVIPHCGSFLPLALQRMRSLLPIVQKAGRMQGVDIEANTRNFYYDLAGGATEETLRSLLTITTSDHILFGSDFPYVNAVTVKRLAERFKNMNKKQMTMSEDMLFSALKSLFLW